MNTLMFDDDLNEKQLRIVHATEQHILVLAAPASGKTRVVTERIKYLLKKGIDPTRIVGITFTNLAAETMMDRLGHPAGVFIGTIHSYANKLLKGIGINTDYLLEDERFDELFELIEDNLDCIKPVDYLICDEFQDTSPNQQYFLEELICPTNWMFVGDYRQSIYGFNGAYPEHCIDLSKREDVTCYPLNQNYRNDIEIFNFAKSIIQRVGLDYRDNSICMSKLKGKVDVRVRNDDIIAKELKIRENYGKWFILTRTNEDIDKIMATLKKYDVPCETFKKKGFDVASLQAILDRNTVKVLTVHTAKGMEIDNVIVVGMKDWNSEEFCVQYVAATRAKHYLVWTTEEKKQKRKVMHSVRMNNGYFEKWFGEEDPDTMWYDEYTKFYE